MNYRYWRIDRLSKFKFFFFLTEALLQFTLAAIDEESRTCWGGSKKLWKHCSTMTAPAGQRDVAMLPCCDETLKKKQKKTWKMSKNQMNNKFSLWLNRHNHWRNQIWDYGIVYLLEVWSSWYWMKFISNPLKLILGIS